MGEDPLERFRKAKNESAEPKLTDVSNKRAYVAFKAADRRQIRLKIRPYLRAWERIPYGYLHRILEDADFGGQIGLIYSFAVVIIKGRNMQEIAAAISDENCEFVQAFDPVRWDKPVDLKAPFIESIDFSVETRDDMVRATDKLLDDVAKAKSSN